MTIWKPVRGLLAAERQVIAVDLPGFGRSDELPDGVEATAANLAAAVIDACAAEGIDRPHVAGNSLGAWVALEIAKAGAAASVCGLSPAGLWGNPLGPRRVDRRRLGRRLLPIVKALTRTARGRELLLGTSVARPDRLPPAAARELVLGYLSSSGYDAANRAMRAGAFEHEGRIDVPVTIAWGEEDRTVGRPSRSRMPPGTRYLTVPGWGHTPTWDDPEGVAALILEASSDGAGRNER